MKLLLTGFEPFLQHSMNPTEEIVKEFSGKIVNEYSIDTAILPVDFHRSADRLLQAIEQSQPDVVIMLGLAAGRSSITPERIAINCQDGPKDNEGYQPMDEAIDEVGPDGIFTTLPIRSFVEKLRENHYPAHISNTAGTYLCNKMMYIALRDASQHAPNRRVGFIHIPASHELAVSGKSVPSWSLDDLTTSIELCIEAL